MYTFFHDSTCLAQGSWVVFELTWVRILVDGELVYRC